MAALAHLSMTCLAPGLTLGVDALERRQALGIEAPSMARCGEFDLHQACGLLSADIVRRALKFTGAKAEFRLFIHDDHTDLESGLAKMRELYLEGHQTLQKIRLLNLAGRCRAYLDGPWRSFRHALDVCGLASCL